MAEWHPILNALEGPPAHWRMIDALGREYAEIELRRTEAGPRYRVEVTGEILGWATTLRVAAEQAHRHYLDAMAPSDTGTLRRRGAVDSLGLVLPESVDHPHARWAV